MSVTSSESMENDMARTPDTFRPNWCTKKGRSKRQSNDNHKLTISAPERELPKCSCFKHMVASCFLLSTHLRHRATSYENCQMLIYSHCKTICPPPPLKEKKHTTIKAIISCFVLRLCTRAVLHADSAVIGRLDGDTKYAPTQS